jgi:hypothetical protein
MQVTNKKMQLMKQKTNLVLLLIGIAFLKLSLTSAQEPRKANEKKLFMYNEKVEGKYLPNAFDNKKFSPAYKFKQSKSGTTNSSGIFTTQVNVGPGGQNIIGDAANETSIAINPLNPNMMVIGWRQFDNVASNFRQAGWAFSTDAGATWTFPGRIEQGIFRSDPVLDYDSSGNFYYNSLSIDTSGTYVCKVFKSNNGGASWDPGTDAAGGDKQWMTIDRTAGVGSGNIYSFWSSNFSSCPPDLFTRSSNGGSSYENCSFVDGDPYWGTMAVGNAGELYISGGQNDTVSDLVVCKSNNAQIPGAIITWNTPVSVFMDGYLGGGPDVNPVGLLGQVSIDVDRSTGPGQGNVYILSSLVRLSNFDPGDVMFARSVDGGLTWSVPIRINDDASAFNTQWFGTMSVAPNGRIDAVWLDTRDAAGGGHESALYYSYSVDQGFTWSFNEKLSPNFDPHLGYPDQDKMGDYFDMISDDTGAHLAWANTLNGEQDVYYSYITPQIGVGVNTVSKPIHYSIFPNPGKGVFVLKGMVNPTRVEIYNMIGEKVKILSLSKAQNEIDLSSQASGIYFLKIVDEDGGVVVEKVIKE